MIHKPVFLLLVSLLGATTVSNAQLPFGKKLPLPPGNAKHELGARSLDKKNRDITYSFDTTSKRFVRQQPGEGQSVFSVVAATQGNNAESKKKPPSDPAFSVHLTKDINQLSESFPGNNPANLHYSFAVLNNVSYFFADDGIHGRELWRSDGTANGTYLVKDINPGEAGSADGDIIEASGLLYFAAYQPETGMEPWVSDGTSTGTRLLKDISPWAGTSSSNQFVNVNGVVFFSASNFGSNEQLWKTDGTEAGTVLVKDLYQYGLGYRIFELTAANNLAWFIAYTWFAGYQLFRSDGTDAGTYLVKQIGYNFDYEGGYAPMQLTAYDNKLYFSADDGSGRRLWTSDGTYDGTMISPGHNGIQMESKYLSIYHNNPFTIFNNVLYLGGYTEAGGGGLYKYDAANAGGLVLVKDLTDQIDLPYDSVVDFVVAVELTVANDKLFFKVISNINGFHDEIWSTNGETDQTQLIKIIGAGEPGVYSYNYFATGNNLYFVVNSDQATGNELWKSDGTNVGTTLVKDINPGRKSSFPDDLTFCNGKLMFRANHVSSGFELWSSNGSEVGTMLIKDINTTSTKGSDAGFHYKGIGEAANGILFNAFTQDLGAELYKSDGTSTGTALLNDIAPGEAGSYPNYYIFKNNLTYFIGDDSSGTALYSSNGSTAGLRRVTSYIKRDVYYVVNYNVNSKGLAFYTLGNRVTGALELWRSNGTDAGTFMLTPNLSYYYNNYVELLGNTAIFIAGDFNTGYELWSSDGTVNGTRLIKDINPGPGGSDPYSLFVYNNNVYFGAYDGVGIGFHRSLWKTDGTAKGTVKVKNIEPTSYSSYFNTEPQHVFCESNGDLYFTATEYNTYGNELWKTNGTEKATMLVKDINLYDGSYPTNLTDVAGTLYFIANDGTHGMELWSTRGTDKTTRLVKDLTPGFGGSYLRSFCSAGGKLFFLNNTSLSDGKLWVSDGTESNTKEVVDEVLSGLSGISQLTAVGSKLFFGAYTNKYGTELYAGDAAATRFNSVMMRSPNSLEETALSFRESVIYPNPSRSSAVLRIEGKASNAVVTIADISGKMIWRKAVINEKVIKLPVENLAPGIYLVTVKSDEVSKTLRFAKE